MQQNCFTVTHFAQSPKPPLGPRRASPYPTYSASEVCAGQIRHIPSAPWPDNTSDFSSVRLHRESDSRTMFAAGTEIDVLPGLAAYPHGSIQPGNPPPK